MMVDEVSIPVFLSTGPVEVTVEIQVRTIAMDFWAALEHKIFYKYDGDVPQRLTDDLADAVAIAAELDHRMERLHTEVHGADARVGEPRSDSDDEVLRYLWEYSRGARPLPEGDA